MGLTDFCFFLVEYLRRYEEMGTCKYLPLSSRPSGEVLIQRILSVQNPAQAKSLSVEEASDKRVLFLRIFN